MANDELARVRSDLDTIETALGLPADYRPREMHVYLMLAAAGVVAMIWAIAPHGLPPVLGFGAFIVPVIGWLRLAKTESTAGECQSALATFWLAVPLAGLFALCRYLGLEPVVFLGLATFVIGVILFSAALGARSGLAVLGWAIALMVGGLLLPLRLAPAVAVIAGALAVGGFVAAALLFVARGQAANHVG